MSVQPAALDRLDRTFAALALDGISLVRTFLLCDVRSGVRFDLDGMPAGLDEAVIPDLDALIAAARRHHIRLMPVLLDFHLCKPPRIFNGVQTGGRSRLIVDPDARSAFIDRVLRPILQRYGDEEAILAWDVMNEPEWCLARGPLARRTALRFATLQEFLTQSVACVRAFARQPVTIGCATTNGLGLVRRLGLDFYQVHWYERFGRAALEQPVVELGLDGRPVILGEFSGRNSAVADVLETARRAGYAGALVWSVLAEDAESAYPADLTEWIRTR